MGKGSTASGLICLLTGSWVSPCLTQRTSQSCGSFKQHAVAGYNEASIMKTLISLNDLMQSERDCLLCFGDGWMRNPAENQRGTIGSLTRWPSASNALRY